MDIDFRDEVASRVLQSCMASASGLGEMSADERKRLLLAVAKICYEAADAMLAARQSA
jgi:hypothetical protein